MEVSKVPSAQPDRNARPNVPRKRRKPGARDQAPADEPAAEEPKKPEPSGPGHRIDVTA
jgi:hypothetical protein